MEFYSRRRTAAPNSTTQFWRLIFSDLTNFSIDEITCYLDTYLYQGPQKVITIELVGCMKRQVPKVHKMHLVKCPVFFVFQITHFIHWKSSSKISDQKQNKIYIYKK